MKLLALVFTCFVAISHVGILVLEMFFWNHPVGQKIFAMTPEVAESSAVLAMNQGLYNGFLVAGLLWSLIIQDTQWAANVATFFLLCVAVAGVYGAATAGRRIFFVQTVPAVIAIISILVT